ncbi:hypothetical protein BDR26DRAFT_877125, partial [Obelidium mucronatum]
MVSVKCKFQNQGAVFRCNVEGTLAEGNKAKVFLADVLAAAKVHPATTHFRRKVHSVSWFCQEEYIFDESVLVDIALDPHSPDYFDVAYTDSGAMFDPFASSPLINSPVTGPSLQEKPSSISSKQRRQVPTSVAEVVTKAKGRTGTQDKFISQVKEVGIRFSYLTQDREPPMTKTLAAATLSKEFPNFGNTVEIFRAYVGVYFADLEFQRSFQIRTRATLTKKIASSLTAMLGSTCQSSMQDWSLGIKSIVGVLQVFKMLKSTFKGARRECWQILGRGNLFRRKPS